MSEQYGAANNVSMFQTTLGSQLKTNDKPSEGSRNALSNEVSKKEAGKSGRPVLQHEDVDSLGGNNNEGPMKKMKRTSSGIMLLIAF